jgi:hypothetical protein
MDWPLTILRGRLKQSSAAQSLTLLHFSTDD